MGNNYREEYTAQEREQVEMTRMTYSQNAFIQICAVQEIDRLIGWAEANFAR